MTPRGMVVNSKRYGTAPNLAELCGLLDDMWAYFLPRRVGDDWLLEVREWGAGEEPIVSYRARDLDDAISGLVRQLRAAAAEVA